MKKLNRREFVSTLSLGTGYLVFGNPLTGYSSRVSNDPFQLVKLGESGLETTLLGIGMGFHGNYRSSSLTRQDQEKALAKGHGT